MKEKQKRSLLNSISSLVRPLWLLLVSAAATVVEPSKQGKAGSRVSQPVARSSFLPSPSPSSRTQGRLQGSGREARCAAEVRQPLAAGSFALSRRTVRLSLTFLQQC